MPYVEKTTHRCELPTRTPNEAEKVLKHPNKGFVPYGVEEGTVWYCDHDGCDKVFKVKDGTWRSVIFFKRRAMKTKG